MQTNATDITSSLSAFVGENLVTISELNDTLDNYKTKLSVLEEHLKQQKAQMENEFKKQEDEKYNLYRVEI
jgi:hypothetical protein